MLLDSIDRARKAVFDVHGCSILMLLNSRSLNEQPPSQCKRTAQQAYYLKKQSNGQSRHW